MVGRSITLDLLQRCHPERLPQDARYSYAFDQERDLSNSGEDHAFLRRRDLRFPRYDAVAATPAVSAVRTAMIISGSNRKRVRAIPELWIPDPATNEAAATIDAVLEEDGIHKPLEHYLMHSPAGPHLARFALGGRDALCAFMRSRPRKRRFLACIHAIYLEAIAEAFLRNCDDLQWVEWHGELLHRKLGIQPGSVVRLTLNTDLRVTNFTVL